MSADTDQAAVMVALLNGKYESIHREQVASFLGAHPSLVPLLEDLHCRLSTAFPGARIVLRHLTSPQVASPSGDGHLLVVVVPATSMDDPSGRLSDLLRTWTPQQAASRAFLLVDVASAGIDPYASDADAVALYVRRRSSDYAKYLDAARRFVVAPPNSRERFRAAAALSAIRRSHQAIAQEHQRDTVVEDEQATDDRDQVPTPH